MKLTPRQKQILGLIARGYSRKEISKELGVAKSTVKNTMSTVLERLEAKNSPNAVYICMREGWI